MLDDLKFIHQRDSRDALGIAEKQYQQLLENYQLPKLEGDLDHVIYGGMGGSALAGLLIKTWPNPAVPYEVVRQYHLPPYVSPQTLYIGASYSGNTEEEMSMLAEAEEAGAAIVVIDGGGELQQIAESKDYPSLLLPKVVQPRYAVLANLKAIVEVLVAAGLVDKHRTDNELANAADFLKQTVQAWLPTVASDKNPAKQLAMELAGKSIAVYGGPLMTPAAYKWKINFNENAKNVAWWNELPEFDHNELLGWSGQPHQKPYGIINLVSKFEHPRVLKRFEVAEKLLSGRRPAAYTVEAQGDTLLEQLLWTVVFGDFVSIYLGLVNNVDPAPVDLIEKFKDELNS